MIVKVKILHFSVFHVFEIDIILTGHLWSYVHYTNLSFLLFHKGKVVELLNVASSVGGHTSSLSS